MKKRAVYIIPSYITFLQVRRGKGRKVRRLVFDVSDGKDVARISRAVAKILRRAGVKWI